VVEEPAVSDDARGAILGRVRAALGDVPAGEPVAWVGEEAPAPAVPDGALLERFTERVEDYRATVTTCAPGDVGAAVGRICDRHAAVRLAVPPGLPHEWLPAGIEALADEPPLDREVLDDADGVITGSALGIAETGTIVLDGGPLSGRRALTLIPDLHICVVGGADLVADVPDAIAALGGAVRAGRPITLISGPSATSDIELDRVEGVHGPRRLEVLLV
jgi:L-lactate dehydrogenase complex protein LldG